MQDLQIISTLASSLKIMKMLVKIDKWPLQYFYIIYVQKNDYLTSSVDFAHTFKYS